MYQDALHHKKKVLAGPLRMLSVESELFKIEYCTVLNENISSILGGTQYYIFSVILQMLYVLSIYILLYILYIK